MSKKGENVIFHTPIGRVGIGISSKDGHDCDGEIHVDDGDVQGRVKARERRDADGTTHVDIS